VMRTQEEVIALLEKAVSTKIQLRPAFKPLLSVSGIGKILGLTPEAIAAAILSRWGASENTFKHIKERHPLPLPLGLRPE
jgi:hypothetical protein